MENQLAYKVIEIDDRIRAVKDLAIAAAIEYQSVTGRKLGITGEVGEIIVADKMSLKLLADPIAAGFDAVDDSGKLYQIKACRNRRTGIGKTGRFSTHHFNLALVGIFDANYVLTELWQASIEVLEPVLAREPRRNPSISRFKSVATRIF